MNDQCPAQVLMHDDRWGGITNQCELDLGHDFAHQVSMTACEPIAYLHWRGTYVPA